MRKTTGLLLIGLAVVAPVVTACDAGMRAEVSDERPVVDAAMGDVPSTDSTTSIHLSYVYLAPPASGRIPAGSNLPLYAWIYNRGAQADRLTGVDSPDGTSVVLVQGSSSSPSPSPKHSSKTAAKSPAAGSATSPSAAGASPKSAGTSRSASAAPSPSVSGAPVSLAIPSLQPVDLAHSTGPHLMLLGTTKDLLAGEYVPITFHFENAGSITLQVPISLVTGGTTATATPTGGEGYGPAPSGSASTVAPSPSPLPTTITPTP